MILVTGQNKQAEIVTKNSAIVLSTLSIHRPEPLDLGLVFFEERLVGRGF